ncbi:MAG: ParB/RepB/Spo0J family partition protein [Eubacterium sp.]|nr:ParB/RepB/Spo0J family partition protein [Eubacterium sp.]
MTHINNIILVKTEKLLPNPYQPRRRFESEDMLSLADSIKENGILQPLIIIRINNSDYYEIVAGERRLRASILAGLEVVPCIETECSYEDSAVYSILENIQRSDLTFFEEASALGQLINHFGLTQSECAKRLGKSQSALSNKLRLLRLPVDVRYFIEKEQLSERHARALLRLEDEKDVWKALNAIKERRLNTEQTDRLIDSMTDKHPSPRPKVVRIIKDVRIFVNTVNKAIETMLASGIEAESDKTETDDYIEYHIKIPKKAGETFKKPNSA